MLAPQFLFASAAAALKCTRFGEIAGVPARAEVEQLSASVVASKDAINSRQGIVLLGSSATAERGLQSFDDIVNHCC